MVRKGMSIIKKVYPMALVIYCFLLPLQRYGFNTTIKEIA